MSNTEPRIIQIMPAPGWRCWRCNKTSKEEVTFTEVGVIGWALFETGAVELLMTTNTTNPGSGGAMQTLLKANDTAHVAECYESTFNNAELTEKEKQEITEDVFGIEV